MTRNRIVLMTPDRERGLCGALVTPARKVGGERITTVLLDGETVPAHYPSKYVRRQERAS